MVVSDFGIKLVGLACAIGSVGFAGHMFTQNGPPRLYAMEEFGIFAQPKRAQAVEAALQADANKLEEKRPPDGKSLALDLTPVGVVPSHSKHTRRRERASVRIVRLNPDEALLETPDGFQSVRVGDQLPDMGQIIAIRQSGQYWVVVASLRSVVQAAPSVSLPNQRQSWQAAPARR